MRGLRLQKFEFRPGKRSPTVYLFIKGHWIYIEKVRAAFPEVDLSDIHGEGDLVWPWYARFNSWSERYREPITAFLALMQSCVLLRNDLDDCFALDWRVEQNQPRNRTPIGQLVYQAKQYDSQFHPGSRARAAELARYFVRFVQAHPLYQRADVVVRVPPSTPNKSFDLPTELATILAEQTGKQALLGCVSKSRLTRPMKDLERQSEKRANLADAFWVEGQQVIGKSVIVVDDLYETGLSIQEVGRMLKASGASNVLGLVAVKTLKS